MAQQRSRWHNKFLPGWIESRLDDLFSRSRSKKRKPARRLAVEALEDRLAPAVTAVMPQFPSWQEQGPAPTLNGQAMVAGNSPVAGAIHTIAVAPSNHDVVYVGSTTGGVWRTGDIDRMVGGVVTPDWQYTFADVQYQGVTAIAVHPTNHQKVLAGLGSLSNGSVGTTAGGIVYSDDGGASWIRNITDPIEGYTVHQISWQVVTVNGVAHDRILVASDNGLHRYQQPASQINTKIDVPANWSSPATLPIAVPETATDFAIRFPATDVVVDPGNSQHYYAAFAGNFGKVDPGTWSGKGVYRSTDGGVTWTKFNTGIVLPEDSDKDPNDATINLDNDGDGTANETGEGLEISWRIRLGISHVGSDTGLFAGVVSPSTSAGAVTSAATLDGQVLRGLFYVKNPATATTWSSLTLPKSTDNVVENGAVVTKDFGLHPGKQGYKNFSLLADPRNITTVYVGGDRQPSKPSTAFPTEGNAVGATGFVGRVFRGVVNAADPAAVTVTWTQTIGNNANNTAPHADSRTMVFLSTGASTGYILEGDDGGIFRFDNPDATGTWSSVNGDLAIAEIYEVAYDAANQVFVAGTQDNGLIVQTSGMEWNTLVPGDAGTVALAPGRTDIYYSAPFNINSIYEVNRTNPGTSNATVRAGGILKDDRQEFVLLAYNQVTTSAADKLRLLAAGEGVFESHDGGTSYQPVFTGEFTLTTLLKGDNSFILKNPIRAIAYGGFKGETEVPDVLYVARGKQVVVRHPSDDGTALAAGSPTTTGFLTTFNGNNPAQDLQAIVLDIAVDPRDWEHAYAITAKSIWETKNGGIDWDELPDGPGLDFNRTATVYDPTPALGDDVLIVGGRGGVEARVLAPDGEGFMWTRLGDGLPPFSVTDVHIEYGVANDTTDDFAYIGTFGRGVWKLPNVTEALNAVLFITGTSGNDTITLQRAGPYLQALSGTGASAIDLIDYKPLDLYAAIVFDPGTSGQDKLIIDNSNGFVAHVKTSFLAHIAPLIYYGNTDTTRNNILEIRGGATPATGTAIDIDDENDNGTGFLYMTSNDGRHLETISYRSVLTITPTNVTVNPVAQLSIGLKQIASASETLSETSEDYVELWKNIGNRLNTDPKQTKALGAPNQLVTNEEPLTTGIMRRVFETGFGAFKLDDIGTLITDPAVLEQKLEALDTTANNVSMTDVGGVLTYDVRVNKTLKGEGIADFLAENGLVELKGKADFSVDVQMHLIFGSDADGFFLKADQNPDPELVLRNVHGSFQGVGKLGFLGVELKNGTITFDPNVRVQVDISDPGTAAADGFIRLEEMRDMTVEQVTADVISDTEEPNNVKDLTIAGAFTVSAFNFPVLSDLNLKVSWQNLKDLGAGTVAPISADPNSPALKALDFIQRNGPEIVGAIQALADQIEGITGNNFTDAKIPLLNKTLGELMQGGSTPLDLPATDIVGIAPVYTQGGFKKFQVLMTTPTAITQGLAYGQQVTYTSGGQERTGTIDSVESDRFVVAFAANLSQTPNADTAFHIQRSGQFGQQIRALADGFSFNVPTLQDLIARLETMTGLELTDKVKLTGPLTDLRLEIPLHFDPEPWTLHRRLDLSDKIERLELDGAADLDVVVDPAFNITIGVRLSPGVAPEDRVYIANTLDDQGNVIPEVAVQVSASLNPQPITGTLGFLDITLEKNPNVTPNNGITLGGTFTLNIVDPSATPDDIVTLGEIAADPLGAFAPGVNASFDIDGLRLKAGVGDSVTLATVNLAGHSTATSFAQLPQMFSNFAQVSADFIKFKDITPDMVIALLVELANRLRDLNDAGKLDFDLPLIDKTLGDLVDLAEPLLDKLGDPEDEDNVTEEDVSTAQKVADWLNSKLATQANPKPVSVTVGTNETIFTFTVGKTFAAEPIEIDLNLADGRALAVLEGNGVLNLQANASTTLSIGMKTGTMADNLERFFFATGGANPTLISAGAEANAGYIKDDGTTPPTLNFTAGVGPLGISVVDGRARITAGIQGGLDDGPNNDGRLTFREIVTAAQASNLASLFTANFTGDAQAIIPLDGNGDGIINIESASAPDARIEVAGRLQNIASISTEIDPAHNSNGAIPLNSNQLHDDHFLIHAHNLEGLIRNGLLDPRNLLQGLAELIGWGGNLLDLPLFDRTIPFLGVSLREAFNTFSDNNGGLQGIYDQLNQGTLGESLTNQAIVTLANLLRDRLKNVPGIRVIGDGDRDGTKEDQLTAGDLLVKGDDLLMLERGSDVIQVKFSANVLSSAGDTFIAKTDIDPEKQGIVVGDVVHWTAGGPNLKGMVLQVTDETMQIQADPGNAVPTAGNKIDGQVEVREIIGISLVAKFNPSFERQRAFDIGLDFLNLNAEGNVKFEGEVEILLGIGLTLEDGLFLKTDFSDVPMSGLGANPLEISVSGGVTIEGELGIQVGFIHFLANLGNDGDELNVSFGVDIQDPDNNGKLTIGEIINTLGDNPNDEGLVSPSFTIGADVDAHLTLDTTRSGDLPSIQGDFIFQLPATDIIRGDQFVPFVALENVSLNLGSLVSKIIAPVLTKIGENNPLGPALEFLTNPLPVIDKSLYDFAKAYLISQGNQGAVNTLDFFISLANTINDADDLVDDAGSVVIAMGDFTIFEGQTESQSTGTPAQIVGGAPMPATLANEFATSFSNQPIGSSTIPIGGAANVIGGTTSQYPGDNLPVIGPFIHDLGEKGITFPVLQLSNLSKLIAGDTVDLVFFNFEVALDEPLNFGLSIPIFSFGIPLIANISINAGLTFELDPKLHLSGGFDTRGLSTGRPFLDGIYIGDFDPGANGQIDPAPIDQDRPEFELDATVSAFINATVTILGVSAKITGSGGINGHIEVDLNDDNETSTGLTPPSDTRTYEERHDGKMYLDEIVTVVQSNGTILALADLSGSVNLVLAVDVDLPFEKWDKHFDWSWELFSFNITWPTEGALEDRPGSGGEITPNFATLALDDEGAPRILELTSNAGTSSNARNTFAATNHADGDVVDILLVDKNNSPYDGAVITTYGDEGNPITNIKSFGGTPLEFTTTVTNPLDATVREGLAIQYTGTDNQQRTARVKSISGNIIRFIADGANPVLPKAGTMITVLSGKETVRVRKNGRNEDFGPGETGENFMTGPTQLVAIRQGGQLSTFGLGNDQVFVDPLLFCPVTLSGGPGNDKLVGGSGSDFLMGNNGDDILDGGGGAGKDTLVGGGDDDTIDGKNGQDTLVGDYAEGLDNRPATNAKEGQDFILGGLGNDSIWGDNKGASNTADGPNAPLFAHDIIFGGMGDDLIFAGRGNDEVDGDEENIVSRFLGGNDTIHGGGGHDILRGQGGSDTIIGGFGDDQIVGGRGNDLLYGGDSSGLINHGQGDDEIYGDLITEITNTETGPGDDFIDGRDSNSLVAFGGPGHDIILGSLSHDLLEGGDGDDDIIGWIGNDLLDGGKGNDNILADAGIIDDTEIPETPPVIAGKEFPFTEGFDTILGSLGSDLVLPGNGVIDSIANTVVSTSVATNVGNTISYDNPAVDVGVNINLSSNLTQSFMVGRSLDRQTFGAVVPNFIGTNFNDRVAIAPTAGVVRSLDARGGSDTLVVDALGNSVIVTPTSVIVQGYPEIENFGFETIQLINTNGQVQINQGKLANIASLRKDGFGNLRVEYTTGQVVVLENATSLLINGNEGVDQLTIDFSGGSPIPSGGLTYNGESKIATAGERVFVVGTTIENAIYTPSATKTTDGTLVVDGRTITFTGLAGLEVSGLNALTIVTPNTNDVIATSGVSKTTVTGTSGGIAFVPVTFSGVASVTFDTAANDGTTTPNDLVTINADGLAAPGLRNFTLTAGNGSDELNLQMARLALPVAGGVFQYDGGAGTDTVRIAGDALFTLANTSLGSSLGGSLALANLAGEQAFLTGGASVNRFTLTNWTGSATLDGAAGVDQLVLAMTGGTVTTIDTLTLFGNVSTSAAAATATINGALDLGSTTRQFTVADGTAANDLVINAVISGTSGLTKNGPGTLVLAGNNTYSGLTSLVTGTLLVNGNQGSSPMRLPGVVGGTSGFLGGAGTVGPLGIAGSPTRGTISPAGTGLGTLTVNGDLILTPETTFQANISGTAPRQFDMLAVRGSVALGDATLQALLHFSSSVGDLFKIIDNDGTDKVLSPFVGLAEGALVTVNGIRYQISYKGGDGNDVTLTHVNTNSAFAGRTISSPIAEGGFATLTGRPVDPDPFDDFTLIADWGDGTQVERFTFPPDTPSVTLEHRYLDNGNKYKVRLEWIDQHGGGNTDELEVVVNNVAPALSADGAATGVRGQARSFRFAASDPSPIDQAAKFMYRIAWGDGKEQNEKGTGDVTLAHTYEKSGTYTIRAIATDKDLGTSTEITRTIVIRDVDLQGGDLVVGGTERADDILIRPGTAAGEVEVWLNGDFKGTFTPTGKIVAFGQDGNDTLTLGVRRIAGQDVRLDVPAVLDGGKGDDTISAEGNLAASVLLGRNGDDRLLGGLGPDLLIGGDGRDSLSGNLGSDILIGGSTRYDDDQAALDLIMAEWTREDESLENRKAHLLGTRSGGWNGNVLLNDGALLDDGLIDTLFGDAALDWLIAGRNDRTQP
jgi:autotransporter-associated beta strand protein